MAGPAPGLFPISQTAVLSAITSIATAPDTYRKQHSSTSTSRLLTGTMLTVTAVPVSGQVLTSAPSATAIRRTPAAVKALPPTRGMWLPTTTRTYSTTSAPSSSLLVQPVPV